MIRRTRDVAAVWGAQRLARIAGRAAGRTYVGLDFAPSAADAPRYGWGRPPHARLADLLARDRATYRGELEAILEYQADLARIATGPADTLEPTWIQSPVWLLGLDSASLYALVRGRAPRRYVEVGSGTSTKFVARAKRDGGLSTHVTSIDPQPRADIDRICDVVIRRPLELADLAVFEGLEAGDMVFLDGSHRAFMNSDATVFFLDVLPALAPGVIVGIHDILLPWDYPPEWSERYYSEQYLLAAALLAEDARLRPLLPCHYVSTDAELSGLLEPLWNSLDGIDRRGFAFWLAIGGHQRDSESA
jgi:predicted O-methyltransferase YrrM